MGFEQFPKIPRLSRECVITEKIDGTNAQIWIGFSEDDPLDQTLHIKAGSRTRWITPGKTTDNYGFAAWVEANKDELLKLGPGRHFGEWWGKGINRGYGLEEKRFSLFHTHGIKELPACVSVVPILYTGMFDSDAVSYALDRLVITGSAASPGFMQPEGIVIFHTASGQMFKKTIVGDAKPKGATNDPA